MFAGGTIILMQVARFLLTGMVGLTVNLGVFHMLYIIHIPYLIGSAGAFLVSMIVGFLLQKHWTFNDQSSDLVHRQFTLYVTLALVNLAINTCVVFMLITKANTHYLFAQTIGAGLVAFTSYVVYSRYIFRDAFKSYKTIP
jgi:putative flippase GtrA